MSAAELCAEEAEGVETLFFLLTPSSSVAILDALVVCGSDAVTCLSSCVLTVACWLVSAMPVVGGAEGDAAGGCEDQINPDRYARGFQIGDSFGK